MEKLEDILSARTESSLPIEEPAVVEPPPLIEIEKIFQCDICGATRSKTSPFKPFASEKSLMFHKRMQHGGAAKKSAETRLRNRSKKPLIRRKYQRRVPLPSIPLPTPARRVRFCTVCGTNIEIIERALQLAEQQIRRNNE